MKGHFYHQNVIYQVITLIVVTVCPINLRWSFVVIVDIFID